MVGLYGSFIWARKNKGQGHQTRSQITGRTNRWTSYIQKSESRTSFGKENPTATILELTTRTAITSKSLKPEYMFIQNKKRQYITTNHTQTWPSLKNSLPSVAPAKVMKRKGGHFSSWSICTGRYLRSLSVLFSDDTAIGMEPSSACISDTRVSRISLAAITQIQTYGTME